MSSKATFRRFMCHVFLVAPLDTSHMIQQDTDKWQNYRHRNCPLHKVRRRISRFSLLMTLLVWMRVLPYPA